QLGLLLLKLFFGGSSCRFGRLNGILERSPGIKRLHGFNFGPGKYGPIFPVIFKIWIQIIFVGIQIATLTDDARNNAMLRAELKYRQIPLGLDLNDFILGQIYFLLLILELAGIFGPLFNKFL